MSMKFNDFTMIFSIFSKSTVIFEISYPDFLAALVIMCQHGGNRTLRSTRDSSVVRHFGTIQMGAKCPDILAPVPKCSKDTLDTSIELSSPMV